jgi:hypothetical protein
MTSTSAVINFTPGNGTITGYYAYNNGVQLPNSSVIYTSTTSITITGLTTGQIYNVVLQAYNTPGNGNTYTSTNSSSISFTPSNLAALIKQYKFNDGDKSGSSIKNYVTEAYDSILYVGTTATSNDVSLNIVTTGIITTGVNKVLRGSGSLFIGRNPNYNCYIPTGITRDLSNGFSITGWFYFIDTYNTHLIIADNTTGNPSNYITLRNFNRYYNIVRVYNNGNINGNEKSLLNILPNNNGWFHIGLVFTGINVKFYINNSQNDFVNNTVYTDFVPKYVFIGNNGNFSSLDNIQSTTRMYCDDFRIYNSALTASDVSTIYNSNV